MSELPFRPDLEEFNRLVMEYQASLRAFITMQGVDLELVDDFAQEAFPPRL